MKQLYKVIALVAALLGGAREYAAAQCTGKFSITYPDGTTPPEYSNGTSGVNSTYCPDGTGFASFTITEGNNRGGGTIQVLNSAGTVIKTRTTSANRDTVRLVLPVGGAATNFTFRHTIGCSNDKPVDIGISLNPTVTLAAFVGNTEVTSAICPGTSVTLNASGASSGSMYTFRDASGIVIGQNTIGTLTVTPTTSTSYTVATNTTTCGGSTVTQRITISANELAASASPASITAGNASMLTVSGGAGTYQWYANSGNGNVLIATTTSPTLEVRPTGTTQYTVRGTTASGNCPDDAVTRVTVNGNTLPVSLLGFSAAWAGESIRLKWATATELNNARFVVERSFDGATFEPVGEVAGKGTTTERTDYAYTDAQLNKARVATVYYRLVQQDLDGTRSHTQVQVLHGTATGLKATASPNPFASQLRVTVTLPASDATTFTLIDRLGRTVRQQRQNLPAGAQEVVLSDVAGLPAGLYFLRVQNATGVQQLRLSHQ